MFIQLSLLAAIFGMAVCEVSAAAVQNVPFTITPGPGLPSLESLNLTMADLLDPDFNAKHGIIPSVPRADDITARAAAANAVCQGDWGVIAGAQACINYLNSIPTQNCVADPIGRYCNANDAYGTVVYGLANNRPSASSFCRDVACAVQDVINHCSQINPSGCNPVGGHQFACGNGDLGVFVAGNLQSQSC